jgi:hypothetical protein
MAHYHLSFTLEYCREIEHDGTDDELTQRIEQEVRDILAATTERIAVDDPPPFQLVIPGDPLPDAIRVDIAQEDDETIAGVH